MFLDQYICTFVGDAAFEKEATFVCVFCGCSTELMHSAPWVYTHKAAPYSSSNRQQQHGIHRDNAPYCSSAPIGTHSQFLPLLELSSVGPKNQNQRYEMPSDLLMNCDDHIMFGMDV
jgi:hypothetical protein